MDFKDYKAGQKESGFWFKAKRDLIKRILKKINQRNLKILIVGCGTGDDISLFKEYGEVYVLDINSKALNVISEDCIKTVGDCCDLQYRDNYFDIVASFDVFEHIYNDNLAIQEVHRVLKKEGYLIFSVPAFPILYSSHDVALEHERRYSKRDIKSLMSIFKKSCFYYWNFSLFIPIAISRLIKKNSKPMVDSVNFSKTFDKIFFRLLKFENKLIANNIINFPFGLSIWGICRK